MFPSIPFIGLTLCFTDVNVHMFNICSGYIALLWVYDQYSWWFLSRHMYLCCLWRKYLLYILKWSCEYNWIKCSRLSCIASSFLSFILSITLLPILPWKSPIIIFFAVVSFQFMVEIFLLLLLCIISMWCIIIFSLFVLSFTISILWLIYFTSSMFWSTNILTFDMVCWSLFLPL